MTNNIGDSVKRVEDPRFIQGKGRFVANLKLPGMVYVAIKRSPYAHANITSIDASAALALKGVVAVYTGKDLKDAGIGSLPCGFNPPGIKTAPHYALAIDRVRYVGDGVAAVVANDPYTAFDALDLVDVTYESLPVVVDAKKAAGPGVPQLHDEIPGNVSFHWQLGERAEIDKVMAAADHVVELDLINQRLIPNAMEPRACIAQWSDFSEEMTVWTTSQNPHLIRFLLSAVTLGIPENKLRVISPDVGGGFGSKVFHYPEEVIVPFVAKTINRPAKWVASRSEAFLSDAHGRDHVTTCKLAVSKEGAFLGLAVTTYANLGAYLSTFAPLIPSVLYITLLSGLYKLPVIFGETYGTMSNTVPVDAYRGAGRPEASYVVERLVDIAARDLKMDPIELRRKNFIQPDEFPYQTPVALLYDSGNYPALFDKAVELADYPALVQKRDAARQQGRLVGIGVSGCIEACGLGPSKVVISLGSGVGLWESSVVRVHPDTGKVSVMTGSHAHGQGHETTFAQIVAGTLGIPFSDIEVIHGDTGRTPFGLGTYGSRSAAVGGSAVLRSTEKVREKVVKIAAHQLEAAVEDMVYDNSSGKIYVKGSPDRAKSFAEIAIATLTAHQLPDGMEPGLEETTFFDPPNFTFPCSAHIALVEIDRKTGEVTLQKYAAVDDVGKVINPMIVEGQILGGIAQGVGQALWEGAVYDENGQLLSGTLMDYTMPRDGFPMIDVGRIETPSPSNPLGVKGVGEMGTIISPVTVANAVMDALAPLGLRHVDMPLTMEKLYNAIHSADNGNRNGGA